MAARGGTVRRRVGWALLAGLSVVSAGLLVIHLLWPDRVDAITLVLLVMIALPGLGLVLDSAELPGGVKVRFRELQGRVDRTEATAVAAMGAASARVAAPVAPAPVAPAPAVSVSALPGLGIPLPRFCLTCGTPAEDTDVYCARCGATLPVPLDRWDPSEQGRPLATFLTPRPPTGHEQPAGWTPPSQRSQQGFTGPDGPRGRPEESPQQQGYGVPSGAQGWMEWSDGLSSAGTGLPDRSSFRPPPAGDPDAAEEPSDDGARPPDTTTPDPSTNESERSGAADEPVSGAAGGAVPALPADGVDEPVRAAPDTSATGEWGLSADLPFIVGLPHQGAGGWPASGMSRLLGAPLLPPGVADEPEVGPVTGLAREYEAIRNRMPGGPTRTSVLNDLFGRLVTATGVDPGFDAVSALRSPSPGGRLAGYAYAFAHGDGRLVSPVLTACLAEPLPFSQYWALRALSRLVALIPPDTAPPGMAHDLTALRARVTDDNDRWREVDRILALLAGQGWSDAPT